jgi:hypothetical protein
MATRTSQEHKLLDTSTHHASEGPQRRDPACIRVQILMGLVLSAAAMVSSDSSHMQASQIVRTRGAIKGTTTNNNKALRTCSRVTPQAQHDIHAEGTHEEANAHGLLSSKEAWSSSSEGHATFTRRQMCDACGGDVSVETQNRVMTLRGGHSKTQSGRSRKTKKPDHAYKKAPAKSSNVVRQRERERERKCVCVCFVLLCCVVH